MNFRKYVIIFLNNAVVLCTVAGETVENDHVYNCYGATCSGGSIMYYDHQCFIQQVTCPGESVRVPGECCARCLDTTVPTTVPTTGHAIVG